MREILNSFVALRRPILRLSAFVLSNNKNKSPNYSNVFSLDAQNTDYTELLA